jgi:hypothetical protein
MKISLDIHSRYHWFFSRKYYSFDTEQKMLDYFFPESLHATFDHKNPKFIMHGHNSPDGPYDPEKIYMFVSVENCPAHSHYWHYNKYGNYGNPHMKIYLYNHICKIEETPSYISIPVIYTQMHYFAKMYQTIKPSTMVPFHEKKFGIVLSTNSYRSQVKEGICEFLSQLGKLDTVNMHKPAIGNKSCYHSAEFLNVIQQYKFAFVSENAVSDGYVTEKIFNCLFARCIPIYNGAPNVGSYINENAFINTNDLDAFHARLEELRTLATDEAAFQAKIDAAKINPEFDDEDYAKRLEAFIGKHDTKIPAVVIDG